MRGQTVTPPHHPPPPLPHTPVAVPGVVVRLTLKLTPGATSADSTSCSVTVSPSVTPTIGEENITVAMVASRMVTVVVVGSTATTPGVVGGWREAVKVSGNSMMLSRKAEITSTPPWRAGSRVTGKFPPTKSAGSV